jgi:demethylmenaquinone methyltransferase/2-methoxy-6-polyprenyl-1,4-benzoquinol methylase
MSRPAQIEFLSRLARAYDPVARVMGFRPLWEALAARAAPSPGERCVDVCAGTGGVALALARRGARVLGVDLSPGMLARARRKALRAGLESRARFARMDARSLALPDASVPLVTCAMALHEMSEDERESVIAELRRVASRRVLVGEYRVPAPGWRRGFFQLRRAYEYLESDDFQGFTSVDVGSRLAAVGFSVESPLDEGPYRIWPCHVPGR